VKVVKAASSAFPGSSKYCDGWLGHRWVC